MLEETKLVESLKGGEKEAFDKLYQKYHNILFRMAYLVSGSLSDAEDIVQETFVKCYLHIGELRNSEGFRSWIFQILYRSAYYQIKKGTREIPKEEINLCQEGQEQNSSLDRVLETEVQKQVKDAVQSLDFNHRVVVILHYYNDMTTKEIAKTLACTEGTVKSRLHYARKKLKETIVKQQEGGAAYEKEEYHFS